MCICKCIYNIIYIFINFIKSSVRNALTPTNPGHLSFISSNPGSGSVATRCIILLKAHCRAICHDLVRLRSTRRPFNKLERIIIHRKAHPFKIAQKHNVYSASLYVQNNYWQMDAKWRDQLELVSPGRIQRPVAPWPGAQWTESSRVSDRDWKAQMLRCRFVSSVSVAFWNERCPGGNCSLQHEIPHIAFVKSNSKVSKVLYKYRQASVAKKYHYTRIFIYIYIQICSYKYIYMYIDVK